MKPLFTLFILLFTLLYFWVVFYWSPLEINQGYVQKIMYLHVPSIFMAYLAIFGVFIFSIGYLWKPNETVMMASNLQISPLLTKKIIIITQ